jgi:hypothetical protein
MILRTSRAAEVPVELTISPVTKIDASICRLTRRPTIASASPTRPPMSNVRATSLPVRGPFRMARLGAPAATRRPAAAYRTPTPYRLLTGVPSIWLITAQFVPVFVDGQTTFHGLPLTNPFTVRVLRKPSDTLIAAEVVGPVRRLAPVQPGT